MSKTFRRSFRSKALKQSALKAAHVLSLTALVLNMSGLLFILPTRASAATVNEETTLTAGSIWTTRADCGDETQDVNQYAVGEHVFINGKNFDPEDNPYNWNINSVPPATPVAQGTHAVSGNGTFCFDAYTIQPGDEGEYKVTFANKHDNYRVEAPPPTFSLSGYKFNDLNSNGNWNDCDLAAGGDCEPGLADWEIQLFQYKDAALAGEPYDTDTTDENGAYMFEDVPTGTYALCEVNQDGWTQTRPDTENKCYNNIVLGDETAAGTREYNFGNHRDDPEDSHVHGTKINDLDQNGQYTSGEPALADWEICLYELQGKEPIECTQTELIPDAEDYVLPTDGGLPAGLYRVCETMKDGWTSNNETCRTVELNGTDDRHHIDFFNYEVEEPTFRMTGYKFNDLNNNGDWENCDLAAGGDCEPGLADWTINLFQNKPLASDPYRTTTTDSNGAYAFGDLPAGSYTVCEENKPGWDQTFPDTASQCYDNVTLGETAATGISEYNFGNHERPLFSLTGYKWNDQDSNHERNCPDVNLSICEPLLPDWTINLYQADPASIVPYATDQTDENGWYEFTNLPAGSYTVCEVNQPGWTQTYPNGEGGCHDVTLGETLASRPTYNFGNHFDEHPGGQIDGYKWHDLNGNGVWDEGEPGLPDWTIHIANGKYDPATTNSDGYYSFNGLGDGEYIICELPQENWQQTYPTENEGCHNVTITNGHPVDDVNFGNFKLFTISGQKFNDLNGNGAKNAGESGLQNWTINLDLDANGSVDATTVTDVNGNYSFSNLGPGTYRLREVQQGGWSQTTGNPADIVAAGGTNVSGVDFGNFQTVTLSGQKFNDLNGNGVKNAGEPGLVGWTMNLDVSANGTVDATTVTNGSGDYNFANLGPGTYRVREVQQAGWTQTTANPADVIASSGTNVSSLDFGNFQNITISGQKFNDLDGDGAKDAGEPGLQNWTMNLDVAADGTVNATTVTDVNGNYSFSNLGPGTYRLREVQQADWTQTTANPADVVASSGVNVSGADFGNFQHAAEVPNNPALTLTKTVNTSATLNPGDTVDYTVKVTNSGNVALTNVTLNDLLEDGLFFAVTPFGTAKSLINGGTLAVGESATFTYEVKVGADTKTGEYDNTATADATEVEPQSAKTTVAVKVGEVLGEAAAPALSVVKTVDAPFANPGDTVTYTVVVKNTGDATAENVVLDDNLPAGLAFVQGGSDQRQWQLGDLEAGESVTIVYDVFVNKTINDGKYDNVAMASADNVDPVKDTADIQVRQPAVLGESTGEVLAATGAGARDLTIFGLAAMFLVASATALVRLTRQTE